MIRIEIAGELACFTRPEFKVERVSYDVITPSAVRGIIDSIFFHPGLRWVVDRIFVAESIEFTNIRRNEVSAKASVDQMKSALLNNKSAYLDAKKTIQQRATMALKNVRYVCDLHFEMTDQANETDNPAKFQSMVTRRLKKGQCFQQPFLGCREFPAKVSLCEELPACPPELKGIIDLGYMFYDFDYSDPKNIRPLFYRAVMQDGLIDLTTVEVKG